MEGTIMKKLWFAIIIFMFIVGYVQAQNMGTAVMANDPKPGQQLIWHGEDNTFRWEFVDENESKYEVTIHIVYNSISNSEIADLIKSQLRKHKDACKVEIKIKNIDQTNVSTLDNRAWSGTTLTTNGDAASD
jgi:hypothetical protein